jgi:hypothetical protein
LVFAATAASVQAQRQHEGFWISFAPGGIAAAGDEGLGYPLYLRLGGTLTKRLLVGVEFYSIIVDYWDGGTTSNLSLMASRYPFHSGGLFIRAGLGLSIGSVGTCSVPTAPPGGASADEGPDATSHGFGSTVGLGYDVRLGRNFYMTPNVDLLLQTHERPCRDPTGAGPLLDTSPAVALTVGFTWH